MAARLRRRHAAERRFRLLGLAAVLLSAGVLAFLLITMVHRGATGFVETRLAVPIDFAAHPLAVDPAALRLPDGAQALAAAGLPAAVDTAAARAWGQPALLSPGAWLRVRGALLADPALLTRRTVFRLPAAAALDAAAKGRGTPAAAATATRLRDALSFGPARDFLTGSDATDPTRAGILGALAGSLMTMAVTLGLAIPVGIAAALYLEEFAARNRWTDLLELAINNLAAVPSIIFGLLGLAVFLGTLGLPRSAPLVGGLTLALMTMPVIVIAGRAALRTVPWSVRDAALGIGASRVQLVLHHLLPPALPGILTGTILGTARALGETAPLLLIGMRAFIAAPPAGLTDPATALPVQIFLWSDQVDRGFVEKTSAAILVLLLVLALLNGTAVALRARLEARA